MDGDSFHSRFIDASGRAGRAEYFACLVVAVVGVLVMRATPLLSDTSDGAVAMFLISAMLIGIPTIRRLHDMNASGWYAALLALPLIGWIVVLVLLLAPGVTDGNRWAKEPPTP